jgi:hypothetical protein
MRPSYSRLASVRFADSTAATNESALGRWPLRSVADRASGGFPRRSKDRLSISFAPSMLRGLSTPEEAAPYLEEYREDYNRRFSRHPRSSHDVHRRLRETEKLEEIFTLQEHRRVSDELTLHYKRAVYVIEDSEENRKLRGARETVHEHEDGTVILRHEGRELPYHVHLKDDARVTQASIVEHDRLDAAFRWIAER